MIGFMCGYAAVPTKLGDEPPEPLLPSALSPSALLGDQ
jgi:hypothetical protein